MIKKVLILVVVAFGLAFLLPAQQRSGVGGSKGIASYTHANAAAPGDIFAALPEVFTFASGAGGWSTQVRINPDGTFTGLFEDWEMGDITNEHPNGSRYECYFSGAFTDVAQVSHFEYAMRVAFLTIEGTEGEERIVDGVKVVTAAPYGFDDADAFRLYLPGRKTADLPDGYVSWVGWPLTRSTGGDAISPVLTFYGLYNVAGQQGFYSDDAIAAAAAEQTPPDMGAGLAEASSSHIVGLVTAVNSNAVVMRNRPSEEGNPLLRLSAGVSYPCVGQDATGWYKVFHGGYIGYVPGNQVTFSAQDAQSTHDAALLGVVQITSNDFANIRSLPNQDGGWLAGASPGIRLDCVDIAENGWYCVVLPSGQRGYVSNKLCALR